MNDKSFIGETLVLEISGGIKVIGVLVDSGVDLAVIYNSVDYLYIPRMHIQHFTIEDDDDKKIHFSSSDIQHNRGESISLRKTLVNAKGMFLEILMIKNKPIHGYVVSVMNNYLLFYSPIYKHIYISLNHIKWLIPYPLNQVPYGIDIQKVPFNPSNIPLSRTFEEQMEKFIGELVVFDLGNKPHKIGLIKKIENNIIELATGRSQICYLNLRHINSFHS